MSGQAERKCNGFTLIELVAVLAIVAILLSVALPSYQAYMLRVHRTEAVIALMGVAACQEQVYAVTGRYDTTQCIPTNLEHYSIRIDPADATDSLLYTARAEPRGAQAGDACGTLALDQAGRRQASGESSDVQACWNAR